MFKRINLILLLLIIAVSSCTKIITVPIRASGAVLSSVPIIGNTLDGALDTTADVIDMIPI